MSLKLEIKFNKRKLIQALDKTKISKKLNTQRAAKEIGQITVKKMKDLIASGQSPITQWPPRLQKYKDSYKNEIQKRLKAQFGKTVTPVNLKLSGKFLKDLKSEVVSQQNGTFAKVFYVTPLSKKKEQGHREGKNSQRKRPTLPIEPNEKFRSVIENQIKQVLIKNFKL